MTNELRTSTQKASFEKKLVEGQGTTSNKMVLYYTRLDGDAPKKDQKAAKFVSSFTDEEKALIDSLKTGDQFVIHKKERIYTAADGRSLTTWDLDTVKPISTWLDKPKSTFQSGNKYNKNWSAPENNSAKVGGLLHDAVAALGEAPKDKPVEEYVDTVARVTRLLLKKAYEIEAEILAGAHKAPTTRGNKGNLSPQYSPPYDSLDMSEDPWANSPLEKDTSPLIGDWE